MIRLVRELAERTPAERNRYGDFLRILAVGFVVVGHWMVVDVRIEDGAPVGRNALALADWTHWATWVFQVIPVFFLVGGYANAVSWSRHRDGGGDWASWLRRRCLRLLWPTGIFVAAGLLLTLVAAALGVPDTLLAEAAWVVTIILWFLAVYLAITVLTPLGFAAHQRWGMTFVALGVVGVAVADLSRFTFDVDVVAYLNYALVWGAFHQIGIAWSDGRLTGWRRPLGMAAVAGLVLIGLVTWGRYPVSMIGVPGADVANTGPPTLALLSFGLTQIGVVLALEPVIGPWLERPKPWRLVVGGNVMIMSIFLWHVVPVVLLAGVFTALSTSLPGEPVSAQWLLMRPVWVATLAVLLAPLVLLLRLVERPPDWLERLVARQGRSALTLALGLVGVAAASAGLARITLEGFWVGGPTLVPVFGALGVFGGSIVIVGSALLAPRRPV